jgi:hypothetical protein
MPVSRKVAVSIPDEVTFFFAFVSLKGKVVPVLN